MHLSQRIILFAYFVFCAHQLGGALESSDLYEFDRSVRLENGENKFEIIKLDTPINFFTDTFDHIYLNTKGILTFGIELPDFLNVQFPLEYAAIAPFYSNVDTTNAGSETSISFSSQRSERNIQTANALVRRSFADASDFRATNVLIATWENVGRFRANNSVQNTFQVAIICGEEDTFVQFLYPRDGLNWLQGDLGDSGLPDIRAQVGFVAEDGRHFELKGSGTDNAKYLNRLSNVGIPGAWLYRVGHLQYEDTIEEPDLVRSHEAEVYAPKSCANGGNLKCHISAICTDTAEGFCCKCKTGYYGNGYSCVKSDAPLRVTGTITGSIGDAKLNAQLQSYVVVADGRSYTAISPLDKDVGFKSQLLFTLGSVIGWLFAKPIANDNAPNGYEITGGKLNHTTSLRFESSNDELIILQKFDGLNVWDQLAVEISVRGSLPSIADTAIVQYPDVSDEFVYRSENRIRSLGNSKITVDGQDIAYTIEQSIEFEKCPYAANDPSIDLSPVFSKVSKITAQYQERETALRLGMINKIVRNTPVNRCTDGSATCPTNSLCIPDPINDSYSCECRNGFSLFESETSQVCVDIDECSNTNICDQNADCFNELGGYSCRCRTGFIGNGYICERFAHRLPPQVPTTTEQIDGTQSSTVTETSEDTLSATEVSTAMQPSSTGVVVTEKWFCDQCSDNAECFQGVCVCKNGWNGDGYECVYNCPSDFVWSVDRCAPITTSDEDENEVPPFCHSLGCTCPTGYELIETIQSKTCRLIESNPDLSGGESDDDERLPCDVESNCHQNAGCEWVESELRNKCVCQPGYEGDGFECVEREVSCLFENICDAHATCLYDEVIGKSVCKCDKRYEGDGRVCHLAPECVQNEDCTQNSLCEDGVCVCQDGFERDISDFCVPSGYCGGTFCAANAVCQWDNVESVSYCLCPKGYTGDGIQQCVSLPPACNIQNNCGLNAQCLLNATSVTYECKCIPGYHGDGIDCAPDENCANFPSMCHANASCASTPLGYKCSCNLGFIGNGSHCEEPVRQGAGFLVLSQGLAIVKVPFAGRQSIPISMAGMAIGIDKDCLLGRIYWSDISSKNIYSIKYDGSDKQPFITEDIESPEGVAVDWISRRLYWTDSKKDTIEVAALDNPKNRAVIIKRNLVNPRGLAVDPHSSKLYWSDWNRDAPKIEWSNLDGTERGVLLTAPAVNLPNSLTISQRTGELCFADAGTQKIECIETTRQLQRTIATNITYPFGLTVTGDRFYWTDWSTKKIESIDQNGSKYPGIASPLFGNHKMYGLTAVTEECPLYYSPCQNNNGNCPANQICLVNPNSPSGQSCFGARNNS